MQGFWTGFEGINPKKDVFLYADCGWDFFTKGSKNNFLNGQILPSTKPHAVPQKSIFPVPVTHSPKQAGDANSYILSSVFNLVLVLPNNDEKKDFWKYVELPQISDDKSKYI